MAALTALVLLLSAFPLAGTTVAEHKTPTLDPVSFEFTTDATIEMGTAWTDDSGYHWRDTVYTGTASGDITGEAVTLMHGDFKAGADCTDPTCGGDWSQGVLNIWGTLEVTDETGSWAGQYGYYLNQSDEQLGNILLIGHQAYGGQAIAGDLASPTSISYASTGQRLTMTGPTGGISVLISCELDPYKCVDPESCVIDPYRCGDPELGNCNAIDPGCKSSGQVNGGFILNAGDFYDSGSFSARYPLAQPDSALAGEVTITGQHGTLNTILQLQAHGEHHIGYFMLLGGDGAYENTYGFGWVRASPHCNPGNPSHCGTGGSWIGVSTAF